MDAFTVTSFVLHAIENSLGLLINGLLVYLILKKTPRVFRVYRILLLNQTVTDLATCFAEGFIMERLMPSGLTLVHVAHGPCSWLGSTACYAGHSAFLHLLAHSMNSLAISFGYRTYVLYHPPPETSTVGLIVVGVAAISFIPAITLFTSRDDPELVRKLAMEHHPNYGLRNVTIYGNAYVLEARVLYTTLYLCLAWIPIYAFIAYCRHRVQRVGQAVSALSEKTRTMHNQLLKVLTIQAMLPAIFGLAVSTFVVGQLVYSHPLLETSTFLIVAWIPILQPLVTIYFFTPYRRAVIGFVRSQADPSSVAPTGAQGAWNSQTQRDSASRQGAKQRLVPLGPRKTATTA